MDVAVLVESITAVATLLAVGVAIWGSRSSLAEARRSQTRELRAGAYLEILRRVEHRADYAQALTYNLRIRSDTEEPHYFWDVLSKPLPTKPGPDDAVVIRAHLAFASREVHEAHATWVPAMEAVEERHDTIAWNAGEDLTPNEHVPVEWLVPLEPLHEAEQQARQALAKQIAGELADERGTDPSRKGWWQRLGHR